MLIGRDLINDIDQFTPAKHELGIWWLGQHSFVVKIADKIIYLDPFLSAVDGRLVPPLLEAALIRHADVICGSHDHADHIDRSVWPAMAKASPQAKFIVPDVLRAGLARDLDMAPDRFAGLDDGQTIEVNSIRISAIAAAHELLNPDPASGQYPCLQFIIQVGNWTLYHAGDTCMYEGMITKLRRWRHDVMFLPINGRDAKRYIAGIVGNMTYQEAADLAGVLQPRWVIPAHYEMFAANRADPLDFVAYCQSRFPTLKTPVCRHGERLVLSK